MKNIDLLKKEFQDSRIEFGSEIFDNLSTKTEDGKIFPPYIPFVGQSYNEFRILVYSTAQNIKYDEYREMYQNNYNKLTERLYYFKKFSKKYPEKGMSFRDIGINPYGTGVVAALLGVFIFAKFGKKIENLDDINNWIGISNYYKFSLNTGKSDIHPERTIKGHIKNKEQINAYWKFNDDLVKKEIEFLQPKFILAFTGRKIDKIKQIADKETQVIEINDPACFFRFNCSGKLSKDGIWRRKANNIKEIEINQLVDNYLNFINGNYKGHKKNIRIYLLSYYSDWKIKNNAR